MNGISLCSEAFHGQHDLLMCFCKWECGDFTTKPHNSLILLWWRGRLPTPETGAGSCLLQCTVNSVDRDNPVWYVRQGDKRSCRLLLFARMLVLRALSYYIAWTTLKLPCGEEAKSCADIMLSAYWLPLLVFESPIETCECRSPQLSKGLAIKSFPQPLSPPSWGSRHRGAEISHPLLCPVKSLNHRISDHSKW